MINLDHTIFIQIVAFLVLWFLLNRLLFKPFLRLLEEREQRTVGARSQAATLMEEVERLRAEYGKAISKAKDEAKAVKQTILDEARQERERRLEQAREEATRLLETARMEILSEMQRARERAAEEADNIGRQIAEKILGRKVA